MIDYTTTTTDTDEYKRLITGRANDLTILIDDITKGNSVVLFGERRIGKTSLLYLLRDIINNNISHYESRLIDSSLKNILDGLKTGFSNHKVLYLDISTLGNNVDFNKLLCKQIRQRNIVQNFLSSNTRRLSEILEEVNQKLGISKLVILIDESEKLCQLTQADDILSNIKSITQTCPKICLVLAGGEPWYNYFKRDDNPLRNVNFYYLKSASPFAIGEYFIRQPFLYDLNSLSTGSQNPNINNHSNIVEKIINYIAELTGYKPSYVESVCSEIKKVLPNLSNQPTITEEWQKSVLDKIMLQEEDKTLRYFYKANYVDKISQNTLVLLAHQPELSLTQIADKLPHSQGEIRDKLDDLERLGKIYQNQFRRYRIVGTLIESWGKDNIPLPSINKSWIKIVKWIFAILFIFGAVWIYFYTHPSFKTVSCQFPSNKNDFPKSQILIDLPSSLERAESGQLTFLISNLDQKEIKPLTLTFSSLKNQIQYQQDNTNLIKIESLYIGETKYYIVDFLVRDSGSEKISSSVISIISDFQQKSIETCNFDIKLRPISLKKYWIPVSTFLTVIGGFIVKPDLTKLLAGLLSFLTDFSKTESQNKKDDKN